MILSKLFIFPQAVIPISQILRERNSTVKKLHYHVPFPRNIDEVFVKEVSLAMNGIQLLKAIGKLTELLLENCEAIIKSSEIMEEMEKSDLIIWNELFQCGPVLAEYTNKPHVLFVAASLTVLGKIFKIPLPASYVPATTSGVSEEMTFLQRIKNKMTYELIGLSIDILLQTPFTRFRRKHNISLDRSLSEIMSAAEAAILQSHPAVDYAHPLMQSK